MKKKLAVTLVLTMILAFVFTTQVFAMQIFVKTLTGKHITLEVEPTDRIDDVAIAADKYDCRGGSTIVTLKSDYTRSLSVGTHTIAIVSEDGTATASFSVTAPPVTPPQTASNGNMLLWLCFMLASTGVIGTIIKSANVTGG